MVDPGHISARRCGKYARNHFAGQTNCWEQNSVAISKINEPKCNFINCKKLPACPLFGTEMVSILLSKMGENTVAIGHPGTKTSFNSPAKVRRNYSSHFCKGSAKGGGCVFRGDAGRMKEENCEKHSRQNEAQQGWKWIYFRLRDTSPCPPLRLLPLMLMMMMSPARQGPSAPLFLLKQETRIACGTSASRLTCTFWKGDSGESPSHGAWLCPGHVLAVNSSRSTSRSRNRVRNRSRSRSRSMRNSNMASGSPRQAAMIFEINSTWFCLLPFCFAPLLRASVFLWGFLGGYGYGNSYGCGAGGPPCGQGGVELAWSGVGFSGNGNGSGTAPQTRN